jgi:hypothetical protein
MAHMEIMPAT